MCKLDVVVIINQHGTGNGLGTPERNGMGRNGMNIARERTDSKMSPHIVNISYTSYSKLECPMLSRCLSAITDNQVQTADPYTVQTTCFPDTHFQHVLFIPTRERHSILGRIRTGTWAARAAPAGTCASGQRQPPLHPHTQRRRLSSETHPPELARGEGMVPHVGEEGG